MGFSLETFLLPLRLLRSGEGDRADFGGYEDGDVRVDGYASDGTSIFAAVFEEIGEPAVVVDRHGTVFAQNRAACRTFGEQERGLSLEEWGRRVDLRHRESGAPLDFGQSPFSRCVAGHRFHAYLLCQGDGRSREKVFSATGSPLRDGQKRLLGSVFTFYDMTSWIEQERELRRAKLAAEAANRGKTEFLANISHEIRTPMTAIRGYADTLANPRQSPESRRNSIGIIRRNTDILMRLIDDLLDLSKAEAGRVQLERVTVPLEVLVSEVYALLESRAASRRLELTVNFRGALPRALETDPTRLRQILINLVGNAIKFTERGSVTLDISYPPGTGRLEFRVTDTGCGIPKAAQGHLFSPFIQGDASTTRRFGGTGLGLALSRRLAELLGGGLELEWSEEGLGSRFCTHLELGELPVSQLSRDLTLVMGLGSSEPQGIPLQGLEKCRILVVEDNEENRDLFRVFLEEAGATVTTAVNGQDGLDKARAETFDAVLVDIQMPVLDGYALVKVLREQRYPAPLIALTAHAMREERERCRQAGFDEYLSKPVDAHTLVDTIKGLTGKRDLTSFSPPLECPQDRVIDIERIAGGSPRVVAVIRKALERLPERLAELEAAVEKDDGEGLRALIHRFKGMSANCGFWELSQVSADIEELLAEGQCQTPQLKSKLEEMKRAMERTRVAFERFVPCPA